MVPTVWSVYAGVVKEDNEFTRQNCLDDKPYHGNMAAVRWRPLPPVLCRQQLRVILTVLVTALLFEPGFAQDVQPREALLIANGAYQHFPTLQTPPKEAQDLASTLRSLGFHVTVLTDGTREAMLDALDQLTQNIKGKNGTVFFHYGGHGVQVDGTNYLIPVDADIPDERHVSTRAVALDEVMSAIDTAGTATSIVALDACRDNPLPSASSRAATRGLAIVDRKPRNSIIIYSAEAGTTAQDGLFTPALTRAIATPGASLSDLLASVRTEVYQLSGGKQTPGEYSQLFAPVYLAGRTGSGNWGSVTIAHGSMTVSMAASGTISFNGTSRSLPAGSSMTIDNIAPGDYAPTVAYADGHTETVAVHIDPNAMAKATFTYQPPKDAPASISGRFDTASVPASTFKRGNATIRLSAYIISRTPVSQALYDATIGRSLSASGTPAGSASQPVGKVS